MSAQTGNDGIGPLWTALGKTLDIDILIERTSPQKTRRPKKLHACVGCIGMM
jgi:hypothetical protein